jgi:hypothetical protein
VEVVNGELSLSAAADRAEMRASECRRRALELSGGEPINAAHVEFAAQRAAEAKVYANRAKERVAGLAAWVAELRQRGWLRSN